MGFTLGFTVWKEKREKGGVSRRGREWKREREREKGVTRRERMESEFFLGGALWRFTIGLTL